MPMTRRLCGRCAPLTFRGASGRGCRGHVPKAPQHAPRTLLAQPLGRPASLPLRFRDPQTAETWEADSLRLAITSPRLSLASPRKKNRAAALRQSLGHVLAAKISLTLGCWVPHPRSQALPLHPAAPALGCCTPTTKSQNSAAPRPTTGSQGSQTASQGEEAPIQRTGR